MKVLKFSIGFGPRIIHKSSKETEYSLRLLPLGGFVQLEGEDEDSKDERAFSNKPIWQRILVLIAGVTMNIALAIFIYLCIYMNLNDYTTTKIDAKSSSESLETYGLNVGDEIYKINGEKVINASDVLRIITKAKDDNFSFELVKANNEHITRTIKIEGTETGFLGVAFSDFKVAEVANNSAGQEAGFKPGDILTGINGNEYSDIQDYLKIIKSNPGKSVVVNVKRGEDIVSINATPKSVIRREFNVEFIRMKDLDFFHNLVYAWKETKYYLKANVLGIMELISGKAEDVELQGIVGVSQIVSQTESFIEFFYFMSAISLSLGIMNLLPIPGLDGGKLIFVIIEGVRGKPVSKETEGKITLIGFAILIFLMIWITVSDISKIIR
jgi:regulator of sigma E protease